MILLVWMRLTSERNASRFWYLCLEMFCWTVKRHTQRRISYVWFLCICGICFTVGTTYDSHLADVLQIHGVYNHFVIIWHKLLVDRMVKRPWLRKKRSLIHSLSTWSNQWSQNDWGKNTILRREGDSHQGPPSFSVSRCCQGWRRRPPDRRHPAGGWLLSPTSPTCPLSVHTNTN